MIPFAVVCVVRLVVVLVGISMLMTARLFVLVGRMFIMAVGTAIGALVILFRELGARIICIVLFGVTGLVGSTFGVRLTFIIEAFSFGRMAAARLLGASRLFGVRLRVVCRLVTAPVRAVGIAPMVGLRPIWIITRLLWETILFWRISVWIVSILSARLVVAYNYKFSSDFSMTAVIDISSVIGWWCSPGGAVSVGGLGVGVVGRPAADGWAAIDTGGSVSAGGARIEERGCDGWGFASLRRRFVIC